MFSIIGVSTSLYNLWLVRFTTFSSVSDVLNSNDVKPIFSLSGSITDVIFNVVSFAVSGSISAWNVNGSICSPTLQLYFSQTNVVVSSSFVILSTGSP